MAGASVPGRATSHITGYWRPRLPIAFRATGLLRILATFVDVTEERSMASQIAFGEADRSAQALDRSGLAASFLSSAATRDTRQAVLKRWLAFRSSTSLGSAQKAAAYSPADARYHF
jgi:hypothetical protein